MKCRICARSVKNDKRRKAAREYSEIIREIWRVNVDLDSPNVQMQKAIFAGRHAA